MLPEWKWIENYDPEIEEWLTVKDNLLYRVSNFGVIVNQATQRIITPALNSYKKNGQYLRVQLRRGGVGRSHYVHRVVALVHVKNDDPTNKIEVDHIDGNPFNNRKWNLEWVTPYENKKRMHERNKRKILEAKYDPEIAPF